MDALVRCARADALREQRAGAGAGAGAGGAARVYRFFERNGGEYYHAVDDDARELAARFFHSTNVLKFADLGGGGAKAAAAGPALPPSAPFLALSPAVFASVAKALLAEKDAVVRAFTLEAGAWTLQREGSAGRTSAFARELESLNDIDRAAVEQTCVACVWIPSAKSAAVGVAVVNTTFRSVGAAEVALDALGGLLAQEGVSQCIVGGNFGDGNIATKVDLALRAAGARRLKPRRSSHAGSTASGDGGIALLEEVVALLGVDAVSQVDSFLVASVKENASVGHALAGALAEFADQDSGAAAPQGGVSRRFRVAQLSLDNSMYISPSTLQVLTLMPRPAAMSAGGPAAAAAGKPELASVFHSLGKFCQTPMGVRRLARWLRRPSKCLAEIRRRHDAVAALVDDPALAESMAGIFRHLADGERLALSLETLRVEDGDNVSLGAVKRALNTLVSLFKLVHAARELVRLCDAHDHLNAVASQLGIRAALDEAEPFAAHIADIVDADTLRRAFRHRGYDVRVAARCSPKLERVAAALAQTNASIRAQAASFASSVGADQVRVRGHGQYDEVPRPLDDGESPRGSTKASTKSTKTTRKRKRAVTVNLERNAVHGTVFRVTRADGQLLLRKGGPADPHSVRVISRDKQGVKFTTEALADIVSRHDALDAEYLEAQAAIVREAVDASRARIGPLLEVAAFLAVFDALAAFARAACDFEYCRPELVDEDGGAPGGPTGLELVNLRHVLAEQRLGRELFIANTFASPQHALSIVSGPNMGGKSTFSSSVALAAVLAQAGSFVPADAARLPVFDALLARAGGALDDSSTGSSTFMVEMRDIASILSMATPRSLVIVDEIGRGTSTDDGFALAKAIAQHFVADVRSLVLFATHFHELADLAEANPGRVQNLQLTAQVQGDNVVMLYKVKPGAADRSYGISVAKMAHFPEAILDDARAELVRLEEARS